MTRNQFEEFKKRREEGNARVLDTDHVGIKRFFRLDVDAFTDRTGDGGLDRPTKALLGLVASAVLRCDDCVDFHLWECIELDLSPGEIEDALNVALVVGGSIVIPHLRHARLTLDQLTEDTNNANA